MIDFREIRAGRHCPLRVWKSRHDPAAESRDSPHAADPLAEVCALARPLFAGAVDAREGSAGHAGAVARTGTLIAQAQPRIANATFDAAGLRASVDVLERTPSGRWTAVLVRNAIRVSWALADRAAFTLHVLRCAGVDVAAIHAVLLDVAYVRPDGPVDPARLFVRRSLSFPARRRLARTALDAASVHATLSLPTPPAIVPGAHCRDDRDGCPFLDECTSGLPEDWTGWLPRKDKPPIREWLAQDHLRMADVLDVGMLPRGAAHARLASRSGGAHVSAGLADALAAAGPPAYYLDFECVSPAVPVYPGTRPYQTIPFLWSVHHDDGEGTLRHVDDIAPPGAEAPWRRVADGLIRALGSSGAPIVVYSSYEQERLRELAEVVPDLAAPLRAIESRLVDLLEVVREHVYDLRFRGSFSIKQVAPVLAPALTYDGLPIRDGLAATQAYERLLAGCDRAEAAEAMAQLRAYCERDTLAMVELHRALLAMAGTGRGACPTGA